MSDVVYDDEPAAEEEYGSAADEVYEDQPSLNSDQFFGTPEELTFEEAAIEQANAAARAGQAPSGFDYQANPDAKVSDVLAARDEASRADAAEMAQWERDVDELEQQLTAEEQQEAWAEYQQANSQAGERYHEGVREWLLSQSPQMQQQTLAWATQQQLEAEREAEQWRALDERAARQNAPILQHLERMEADDAAERMDATQAQIADTWAAMGVPDDQLGAASELADSTLAELKGMGYELTREVGELVLEHVGRHTAQYGGRVEWREDKAGNMVPKPARQFRAQDFPNLTVQQADGLPSVSSMYFGGR